VPSFDVVSQVNPHELTNAVDQARRELGNRYDLRGTNARIELEGYVITAAAANEFQLKQVVDILKPRLAARHIDLRALEAGPVKPTWPRRGKRSPSSRASSRSTPKRSSPSSRMRG